VDSLNPHQLDPSFFCLSKNDPTVGFSFDASGPAGSVYPATALVDVLSTLAGYPNGQADLETSLLLRLVLASHLAQHIRMKLENEKGFTCTAGISTSKLLSKLVGSQNKPQGQTTLLPPYAIADATRNHVIQLLDEHEIGKVPGIGFTLARKLRMVHLTLTDPANDHVEATGPVSVQQIRQDPRFTSAFLERVLGGPGAPNGIGYKVYSLLRGYDPSPVAHVRDLPRQISIEDTYARLDGFPEVRRELVKLSLSLLRRMHADLLTEDGPTHETGSDRKDSRDASKRWLARPRTLRLSSRVRPPPNSQLEQSYSRSSRSTPLPTFIFSLAEHPEALAERLVHDALTPLFRRLHPERSGWGLCLLNVAVTNLMETGELERGRGGRDIVDMFRNQEVAPKRVLTPNEADSETWDRAVDPSHTPQPAIPAESKAFDPRDGGVESRRLLGGSEDEVVLQSQSQSQRDMDAAMDAGWEEDETDELEYRCPDCDARMPLFAATAHARFHELEG
jgi:DNA polymerase iota